MLHSKKTHCLVWQFSLNSGMPDHIQPKVEVLIFTISEFLSACEKKKSKKSINSFRSNNLLTKSIFVYDLSTCYSPTVKFARGDSPPWKTSFKPYISWTKINFSYFWAILSSVYIFKISISLKNLPPHFSVSLPPNYHAKIYKKSNKLTLRKNVSQNETDTPRSIGPPAHVRILKAVQEGRN